MTHPPNSPDLGLLYAGGSRSGENLLFPRPGDHLQTWQGIASALERLRSRDERGLLAGFCMVGEPDDRLAAAVDGLHHVAFYLGDYGNDDDVFAWREALLELERSDTIGGVDMGPSYIAPKQYGTPGWWFSMRLADGFVVEQFACRQFGSWTARPPEERVRLMSHLALRVAREPDVEPMLDGLAGLGPHLEKIAFTERDSMGHTYGHVRNNASNRVLELVWEERP